MLNHHLSRKIRRDRSQRSCCEYSHDIQNKPQWFGVTNIKSLKQYFDIGLSVNGHLWYEREREYVKSVIPNWDMFLKMLGITSQMMSVKANVTLAMKAYLQWRNHQQFTGYHPTVINNLTRLINKEPVRGTKINAMLNAMIGIGDTPVVDRHMSRMYGFNDTPSINQAKFIQTDINHQSQDLGLSVHEVQAAMWVGYRKVHNKEGQFGSNYFVYLEKILEKQKQLSLFGREICLDARSV